MMTKSSSSIFLTLAAFLICVALPHHALAINEKLSVDRNAALFLPNIQHEFKDQREFMSETIISPPVEPLFKQVKFLKQAPPKTVIERIDRLIHGIRIDIPPEYDHYGYEIRRYMKSILTPDDLNNTMLIPEKLKSARTARVILDYWKKSLMEEMKIIEDELAKGNTGSNILTTYRYNKGIVNAFIPELYSWIDSNIEFLEFLQEIGGEFYVEYPFYELSTPPLAEKLDQLYRKREEGLKRVVPYSPFSAMVY